MDNCGEHELVKATVEAIIILFGNEGISLSSIKGKYFLIKIFSFLLAI